MPTVLQLPNLREGYITLLEWVRLAGRKTSPRDHPTLEVEDAIFTVHDLENVLPVGIGRGLNLDIAALEALQLIGARTTPNMLIAASSAFERFREPDGHFHGSYGIRIDDQAYHVVRKITEDVDTRQAVITLWDYRLDNLRDKRDYPCTIALGFRLRRGRLNLTVVMRSSDCWWGIAYDVFQFTQLQHTIARMLEVPVGTYTHMSWSLHLYLRDLTPVEALHLPEHPIDFRHPRGLKSPDDAAAILARPHEDFAPEWYESAQWYAARVRSVREKMISR